MIQGASHSLNIKTMEEVKQTNQVNCESSHGGVSHHSGYQSHSKQSQTNPKTAVFTTESLSQSKMQKIQ